MKSRNQKVKIALVADIEIERQYFVDTIATIDHVSFVKDINNITSSKVINAGRIIASENYVEIYGSVGQDDESEIALEDLERYGFGVSNIKSLKEHKTGQVLVMTDNKGKSAISLYLGASEHIDVKFDVSDYAYLYTATSIPLDSLYELLTQSKKQSTTVFLDFPNKQSEFNQTYLEYVDYIMPNKQEAGQLLGKKLLSVKDAVNASLLLKKLTQGNIIITIDKDGCVVFDNAMNEPVHIQASKVDVLDETGSGDIFRGVFVNGIIKGKPMLDVARHAVHIASKSVGICGVEQSITHIVKGKI